MTTMPEPSPYLGCEWPIDAGCLGEAWDDYADDVKERASALATNTLRRLTGNRVGGCPITVRPCKQDCNSYAGRFYPHSAYSWFLPHIDNAGAWVNSCGCTTTCSCTALCEVELPAPVGAIYEVKVDGAIIDPASYRLFGNRLTWIGGATCPWPTCQDMTLADTEDNTFSVTYLNSYPVDALGQYAAGILAAEYAASCVGNNCRLPSSVTAITRQGVSYEITPGAFPDGFTGIREVDAYIALWNPDGLKRQMTVWDPSMIQVRH